jgi:hypothetical protein
MSFFELFSPPLFEPAFAFTLADISLALFRH